MSGETFIKKIYSAFLKQEFPADLALVVIWLVVSIEAIYLPVLNITPVRAILALPIVLFIPGYCFIAALFPRENDLDFIERIAFSIGLSIAIVSLVGFGLNFTPWGIRLDPLVIALCLFTLVMIIVTIYRRALLPAEKRFKVHFSATADKIRKEFFPTWGNRVDRIITVAITLAILISILTLIYLIAVPIEGERFTEFYILGEKQMAADYPDLIITGFNYPMFIGVGNHEYKNMTYTIETWTSLMEFDNLTNSTTIMSMDPNDRMSLTLAHNETIIIPYNLSLNKTGYNRVEFLLFNDSVPDLDVTGSDRINASYRNLHLGITVI